MTAEQFCYWLQGFSEIENEPPDHKKWMMIQDHLDSVFTNYVSNESMAKVMDDVSEMYC